MEQFLALGVAWTLGVVVCAALAARVTTRLGLPWRESLMYFGVLPYPDEAALGRRLAPGRPRAR